MRAESHLLLGRYLAKQYMDSAPRSYVRAFLLGCIEPDRNPATYLKGSFRRQWLRGHNWGNAQCYIQRVSRRLERRRKLHLLDFYALGKLIHYTTDAFTHAHNERFSTDLKYHRQYEHSLQEYFVPYLTHSPTPCIAGQESVMRTIHTFHRSYLALPGSTYTDSRYTVSACCSVLSVLLRKELLFT